MGSRVRPVVPLAVLPRALWILEAAGSATYQWSRIVGDIEHVEVLADVLEEHAGQHVMSGAERLADAVSPHPLDWLIRTLLHTDMRLHQHCRACQVVPGKRVSRVVSLRSSPDADRRNLADQIETEAQHQEAVIQQELAEGGDVHVAAGTPGALRPCALRAVWFSTLAATSHIVALVAELLCGANTR